MVEAGARCARERVALPAPAKENMSVRPTRHASPSRAPRPLPRDRDGRPLVPVEGAPLHTCPLREEIHRLRGLITAPLLARGGEGERVAGEGGERGQPRG